MYEASSPGRMAYRSRRKAAPKAMLSGAGSPTLTGRAMLSAVTSSSRSTRPAKNEVLFGIPGSSAVPRIRSVAPVVVRLVDRIALDHDLPVHDGIRDPGAGVLECVRERPVGRLPVAELAEESQRAATQRDSPAAARVHRGAVVLVIVGRV